MKKNNNKFRNNNNNMYNLNYRFDSVSPAGKCCGTALDLIKRYNELAKEAHSAGDYVEMEVFRQYAEHYRKIVTEINERKAVFQAQNMQSADDRAERDEVESEEQNETNNQQTVSNIPQEVVVQEPLSLKRKTLKVVEVKESDAQIEAEQPAKPKRVYKKKIKVSESASKAV